MSKRKDWVDAIDFVDVGDIEKRRVAYRRILRKLVREAIVRYDSFDARFWRIKDSADRIAKELVP